jgi:hypothetical protein
MRTRTVSVPCPPKYILFFFLLLAAGKFKCSADVVLLVEDPLGSVGYFSDAGHTAVWISDACLENNRRVHLCHTGDGVVFSNMTGWRAYGYAAIPASIYLYGATPDGADAIPYGNKNQQLRQLFWNQHLAAIYPLVKPADGSEMLAHAFRRRIYLLRLKTSPEEDAAAISEIHERLSRNRFHFWTNNCTDFSSAVLNIYFPGKFRRQWYHDLAITTPERLGDRTEQYGRKHPERELVIERLQVNPENFFRRRRAQDTTGAALFDWKYAVPLFLGSPLTYASVGVIHLFDDGPHIGGSFRKHAQSREMDSPPMSRWSSAAPPDETTGRGGSTGRIE